MISVINQIADQPDPIARVKALIAELQRRIDDPQLEAFLDELEGKAAFIASAIVSGGHVHEMAAVLHGRAAGL